jgi:lactose/L-arabinose transport system substrate-binding protein
MLFSITAFGATSKKAAGPSGKVTIWAWDPNFNIAVLKTAAANYKKVNPNAEINIVNMAKADIEQKLNTVLATGSSEGLPDISLIEDYNAQKYLQAFPGAFVDLTGKIKHSDFAKYKVSLMTLEGKVYGVPFDSGATGFFYRSDYLKTAGYKPSDLNNITWDKFIEIGKKVKAKTGKAMIGFDINDDGLMRTMIQSAGQWYFDKDGKVNLTNNPALTEALETYKKIYNAGIIKKANGWNEWVATFNKGDAASCITGVWIVGTIKSAKDQSGKWAVAPTPKLNLKGSVNASNSGGSSWYVLSSSKAKDAAIDFLNKEFGGDKDLYQKILYGQGAVGTYLPAQTGKAYSQADPFFGGQKVYLDFSSWMKKIPGVNYGVYTYQVAEAIMAVMPDVVAGKTTVADALKKAQDAANASINQ